MGYWVFSIFLEEVFMKKYLFAVLLISGGLVLGGCTGEKVETAKPGSGGVTGTNQIEQKQGDTTKTGVISTINGLYYLAEPGQTPKEIDSYAVELSAYVGKTVTVTGQYSGDTLFVGSVE